MPIDKPLNKEQHWAAYLESRRLRKYYKAMSKAHRANEKYHRDMAGA